MFKHLLRSQNVKNSPRLNYSIIKSISFTSKTRSAELAPQQQDALKAEVDLKLEHLLGHYRGYKKISRSALLSLVKSVEKSNYCDSKTALHLLKSCGLYLIDLAPHKRQRQLDYLFTTLLRRPQINLAYQVDHYEAYTSNSFINDYEAAHFCPFELSRRMRVDNVRPNSSVNSSLVERLCASNETIDVALGYVVATLIRDESIEDLDLDRFRSVYPFEDFLRNLLDKSSDVKDPIDVNLINPIISFYLRANETSKAIRLVQLLDEINLPANNVTYTNLISGYMYLTKLDEAKTLLEKTLKSLSLNNVFDLQFNVVKADKKTGGNSKHCQEIQEMLYSRYPYEFQEAYSRVLFVNMLYRLCRHNEHETAFNLSQRFFRSHFTEDDPVKKDIINQSINIANYFYKSLVEYSPPESILRYTNEPQAQLDSDKTRHLKSALYHSLLCGAEKPIEFNLALVKEIAKNRAPVKLNFFMPLIVQQIKKLDESVLKEENGRILLKNNVEFKRIESLIRIIKFDFGCEMGSDGLNQILSWLRFDDNNVPKSYINFTAIVDLFKPNRFNSTMLFNCCAYKILNYRTAYIRKNRLSTHFNLRVEDVRADFDDLCGLIQSLRVTAIEFPLHQKLNAYLGYLIESKLDFIDFGADDLENEPVIKTFRLLNERASSKSLDAANRRLKEYLRIKGDIQKPVESLKSNPENYKTSKPKKRVSELEKLISDCEANGSDASEHIAYLISLICAQPNIVDKPVSYLESLVEKKLNNDGQQPLPASICQDLMVFYSKFTLNKSKADEYFEKMTHNLNDGSNFRPENILSYVEFLLANREPIPRIANIFRRIKPNEANYTERDTSRFEEQLTRILVQYVYENSNSRQLQDLVEAVFESKLIDRSAKFANLVMCKHIETNKLKEAFDYYELYVNTYRMSLLEVPLLQVYFRKFRQHSIKSSQLKLVLDSLAKTYDEKLANNMVFFAHILNGHFKEAYFVYSGELNFEIDLSLLELLSKQFNSSPILKRNFSPHLRNILRFNSLYGGDKGRSIENDIRTILDKFN